MKRTFSRLTLYLMLLVLCSCNSDVFVDNFLPSAKKVHVPADGSEAILRFGASNWRTLGLWLRIDFTHSVNGGTYDPVVGDIYSLDGTLMARDTELYCQDEEPFRFVAHSSTFKLTIERTSGKELRFLDAENLGTGSLQLQLNVGNDYNYEQIDLYIDPSPRYQLDSLVYKLNSWTEMDSAMYTTYVVGPTNATETPWKYALHPYEYFQRTFTFQGGDQWHEPIDEVVFQLFGNEKPVVDVPGLDKFQSPALLGEKLAFAPGKTHFPLSDDLLSVVDTIDVPPLTQIECTIKCWYRFTGVWYTLYVSNPQTGQHRVFDGRADLYTPQGYSLTKREVPVHIEQ